MSTRHVWEKWSTERADGGLTFLSSAYVAGYQTLYVGDGYIFHPENSTYELTNEKETFTFSDNEDYELKSGNYFQFSNDRSRVYYAPKTLRFNQVTGSSKIHFGNCEEANWVYVKGSTQNGCCSASVNTKYPSNNVYGSIWYVYAGSDTIDPSAVSILDTPKAGKEVAVSVAPVTNTYGGTISYAYEYSADGGASWQAIQTTTATEVSLPVPEDAEILQVRVRASDDMGFTSADYVVSEAVAVKAAGGVTLLIDGIMREADGLYCCVDGVLRPASGIAVIDGIQRDIF